MAGKGYSGVHQPLYSDQTAGAPKAGTKAGKGAKPAVPAGIAGPFLQLQSVAGAKAAARGMRYRLGEAKEPSVAFDEDFVHDPKAKPTASDRASWAKWSAIRYGAQPFSDAGIRKLEDALEAYQHYRDASGSDLVIDYEKAYEEDSTIKDAVDREIRTAQLDAEVLFAAAGSDSFEMTGDIVRVGSATENWQKTVGRHLIWGSAYVKAESGHFAMTITIHEVDRYNFNRGEHDIASGAPDDVNGRFAVLGWAKSFLTRGTIKRHVMWKRGDIGSTIVRRIVD